MKRIIFSVYHDNVQNHTSVGDYKRNQFRKYAKRLEAAQKQYAYDINAEYHLFRPDESNYVELQFYKLFKLEELCAQYDEVLHIDFDVVPKTTVSFFEYFNLDYVCAHSLIRDPSLTQIRKRLRNDTWNHMDVYTKTCAKNAMLLLYDVIGKDTLINTAVVGVNKQSMSKLNFIENFKLCEDVFKEAILDNLYPVEINSKWIRNNEVFLSFLIEKNKVPYHEIGMQWNFCLDHTYPTPTDACHFLHHVNKEFEISFNE